MTDDQTKQIMPIILEAPTRTEYVTREVNIHRAPTDESVKLLKEMEQAAREKVVESIHVGDTKFECVVHTMLDNLSDEMIFQAVFTVNGKKMTAEHRHRVRERTDWNNGFLSLADEVAKVIAEEVIRDAFAAHLRSRPTVY